MDIKQSPTNLGLSFGGRGVNCLVVFPTQFSPNNSLLILLQISLIFMCTPALRPYLHGERVTLASRLPWHSHTSSCFLCRIYKAAGVTRVDGLPYLRARAALAGGLTFSLVNTPGRVNLPTRVNFEIVSSLFECNRTLSCPGL